MQIISIDKETISSLPVVHFKGEIHLIDSVADVNRAVAFLSKQKVVGIDTETRPAFKKGQYNKVALIQISTLKECFLFRVNITGVPQSLADFLASPDTLKIGLSLHDDFNALHRRSDVEPKGFKDLQDIVGDFMITDLSLQKIYAILFDQRISKGQRVTNWEAPELTAAQMQYASIDAFACLHIYNYLMSGLFNPLNSKYLHEKPEEIETGHEEN